MWIQTPVTDKDILFQRFIWFCNRSQWKMLKCHVCLVRLVDSEARLMHQFSFQCYVMMRNTRLIAYMFGYLIVVQLFLFHPVIRTMSVRHWQWVTRHVIQLWVYTGFSNTLLLLTQPSKRKQSENISIKQIQRCCSVFFFFFTIWKWKTQHWRKPAFPFPVQFWIRLGLAWRTAIPTGPYEKPQLLELFCMP